jgi:uncharacterized small protein (DUF1192 family)
MSADARLQRVPTDEISLREELARIKAEKAARRAAREANAGSEGNSRT